MVLPGTRARRLRTTIARIDGFDIPFGSAAFIEENQTQPPSAT
jgi:hypothetical protein